MNGSRKIAIRQDGSMQGCNRDHQKGIGAVASNAATRREQDYVGFGSIAGFVRAIGLGALVLVVFSPHAVADIVLGGRESQLQVSAIAGGNLDSPAEKSTIDYLPADFRTTASSSGGGATAKGTGSLHSDVKLGNLGGKRRLIVTGSASSSGRTTGGDASAGTTARVFLLSFTLTEESTYTLTGQNSGASTTSKGFANGAVSLTSDISVFIMEGNSLGGVSYNQSLSKSGTLGPGSYQFFASSSTSANGNGGDASAQMDFIFTVQSGITEPSNEIQWDRPAGGSFHTDANWDPQTVPGSNDTALFGLESEYSVNVGTANTERLEFRSGHVTFDNANYAVSATDFAPSGTVLDNARLTLASGTLSGIHLLIGESAAARLDVDSGATLNYTGSLQVGGPGNGILAVNDGGLVFSGEGRIGTGTGGGAAFLDGPNAVWRSGNLAVGVSDIGDLYVDGGATVISEYGTVGYGSGGDGLVEVKGDNSEWFLQRNLYIGDGGIGELKVLDGGRVTCPFLLIGLDAAGNVLIKGAGTEPSFVDVAASVNVGLGESGVLELKDGGVLRATEGISIGFENTSASTGTVIVAGKSMAQSSLLDTLGNLIVGNRGPGVLKIKEDAAVICERAYVGGPDTSGTVELGIDNAPGNPASWTVNEILTLGYAAGNGTGTVALHNGAIVSVGQLLKVRETGMICGNGVYQAPTVENSGTICPGNSPGTLTIDGDYAQTATGRLTIEIGGTNPIDCDHLVISGSATIDGILELRFINGFAPKQGDTFNFLQVGGAVNNGFAAVELKNLALGFQYSVTSDGTKLTLAALNDGEFVTPVQNEISTDGAVTIGGISYLPYLIQVADDCRIVEPDGPVTRQGQDFFLKLSERGDPGCQGLSAFSFYTPVLGALQPGNYQFHFMSDGVEVFSQPFTVVGGEDQTLEIARTLVGDIKLQINGLNSVKYTIQSSKDLNTWSNVPRPAGTLLGPYSIQVPLKLGNGRFYRVRVGE